MNFIIIAGHLGADPETRFTPSGQKVVSFRVAVNIRKSGKEETIWYRITIWGDRFEKMLPYLKKGSAVIVSGELGKPEIYNDREGRQQVSMDITAENIRFSPFGKGDRSNQEQQQGRASQGEQGFAHSGAQAATGQAASYAHDDEEPLPF